MTRREGAFPPSGLAQERRDIKAEERGVSSSNILILGASFGSLLGMKLALAGHTVKLVCLPLEAELINGEGAVVRFPVRNREGFVEVNSRRLSGRVTAGGPSGIDPSGFDLVGLALQEPQYRTEGVRQLLERVAVARTPCLSIMNMPPPPFLARIPGLSPAAVRECYTEAGVWDRFEPGLVTHCSADPQAFRPPDAGANVLQVGLPTNFRAARFDSEEQTALLRRLEADIDAVRYDDGQGSVELPVKLRVHESVFIPLSKWPMLITGNYRCLTKQGLRSIKEAVLSDPAASRGLYDWVVELCLSLGARPSDIVPFERYETVAADMLNPSSAARALYGGAQAIERVDRLVQTLAGLRGMRSSALDEVVRLVEERLELNRKPGR